MGYHDKIPLVYIIFVSHSFPLSLVFLFLSSLELFSTHIHARVGGWGSGGGGEGSEQTRCGTPVFFIVSRFPGGGLE